MRIKIIEQDGRQDIFLPQVGRKELKLIRERLISLLPSLALEKERGIEITEVRRMPRTHSYFLGISSESESEEFHPQLTQIIEDVMNMVVFHISDKKKKSLKKGSEKCTELSC